MAQIYNAGDDFVKSFSAGVQARMTDAQREMEQERQAQLLPAQKEHLKAEIQHLEQEQESAKQLMGLHYENYKSELYKQFKEGTRKMAFSADQKPEASQVQIGAATGLKNAPPEIQQAFQQQMQQPGAMAGPTQTDQLANPSSTQTVDVDKRIDPTGQMTLPNVVSPQDALRQKVTQQVIENQLEAQKAGMVEEAKTPAKIAQTTAKSESDTKSKLTVQEQVAKNAQDLADRNNAARQDLADKNNLANMERVKATRQGQIDVANIRAAATKQAAATKAKVDPEELAANAHMAAMGQNDLTGNTPNTMIQRKILADSGLVPVTKDTVAKLSAFHTLDPVVDISSKLVNELPDSKLAAPIGYLKSKLIGTDVKALSEQLHAFGTNLANNFGVKNRINAIEIKTLTDFLAKPGLTKAQGQERIETFLNEQKNQMVDNILGGVPQKQRVQLLESRGFNPQDLKSKYKDGKGNVMPQYMQKDGTWYYLTDGKDPNAIKYTSVNNLNY